MSATRVLVTGVSGQVGQDVEDVLRGLTPLGGDAAFQPDGRPVGADEFEILGLSHHELDVTDRDAVMGALRATCPAVVVHLAAYTAVDRAEGEVEQCYLVNEHGTANLSLAANDVGAHLIAVSTDYVFDGHKGSAYVEEDVTNPLNVYGASKRAGELVCAPGDTVVRTSWVMGVRGKSVIHTIADRAASGASVRFVDDQTGTVTAASDLARMLTTFVRERPGGYWHAANTGATTWYEIAAYVGTLLGRDDDFATPIESRELAPFQVATRPTRSDLDTTKLAARWTALPEWRDAIARLLEGRRRREVAT
jgi:dTDP-4-dehydrorhamnose reductase